MSVKPSEITIPRDENLESQIIYLLELRQLDDQTGTSSTTLAALLHDNPSRVEKTCEVSARIVMVGGGRNISKWRSRRLVERSKNLKS